MDNDLAKALELDAGNRGPCDGGPNRPLFDRVRKAFLYSCIGFLGLSALVAIVSVLSGHFGHLEIRVILTTLAIAIASICCLCCSAYAGRAHNPWPGFVGIGLAGVSGLMLIVGIWTEIHEDGYWQTAAILSVFAIAAAHALALLAVRLRPGQQFLQVVSTINILALALVITGMIFGDWDDEGAVKLVAVLAILAALETLVIPILGRLARVPAGPARETLVLMKRDDGMYEDKAGHTYLVSEVSSPDPEAAPGTPRE